MDKEIIIPEGYEARIEGNKVILELKESEDERIRKTLLRCCDDWEKGQFGCMAKEDVPAIRACLEKQKEQESIEDVIKNITKNKEAATKFLKSAGIMDDNGELAEMYRSEQKPANSEKPKEWSEADKLHLNNAILVAKKEWGVNSYTARWLESLRDNYKKCNSHWKPSDEQMEALLNAEGLVRANNYPENAKILASLYKDLKKL